MKGLQKISNHSKFQILVKNNLNKSVFSSINCKFNYKIKLFSYLSLTKQIQFNIQSRRQFCNLENLKNCPELLMEMDEKMQKSINQRKELNWIEFNSLKSKIQKDLDKKLPVNIKQYIQLISKIDFFNSDSKNIAEEFILKIYRGESFYVDQLAFPKMNHPHENFANLFFQLTKIDSLSDKDMNEMEQWYFDMDRASREFQIQQRIEIYDAFHHYKLKYGKERFYKNFSKMHSHISNSFKDFMTSFAVDDLIKILQNVIFYDNEEIALLAPNVVQRMNYIINPERNNIIQVSLTKNMNILQTYPRILNIYKDIDKIIFTKEKEKLFKFLIHTTSLSDIDNIPSDLIVCVISNSLVWIENSPELLEAYVDFFYKNLAALPNELLMEIFFLILNSDLAKNSTPAIRLINLIYQNLKNLKVYRREIIESAKHIDYFYIIRKNLIIEFEKWDVKNKVESYEHPDYYYRKILREFVKKSVNLYPFAAIEYDDKLFDNLLRNMKEYIRLS